MTFPSEPTRDTASREAVAREAARRRAERRAYIRTAHPDAGGDPEAFVRGLARFDGGPHELGDTRPTVYRSRRADRVVVHTIRQLRRRLAGRPPRRLE